MFFSPRFQGAFQPMMELHGEDRRKGTSISTVAHLLRMCSVVLTDGGDDEAIAALLNETLEDHPEKLTREGIEARFGRRVRGMAEAATDTTSDHNQGHKPPWKDESSLASNTLRTPSQRD